MSRRTLPLLVLLLLACIPALALAAPGGTPQVP